MLGLQMKKGNPLVQTFYPGDLWIPLEGNTLVLLAILTGVIDMVDANLIEVFPTPIFIVLIIQICHCI